MKNKIIKLAKRLNRFHIEDIVILLNEEQNEVERCLNELIKEEKIQQTFSNTFIFVKKSVEIQINKVKEYSIKIPALGNLEEFYTIVDCEDFLKHYMESSLYVRKKAYKYLRVLDESMGLTGKKLKEWSIDWNKDNPELKVSPSNIFIMRRQVKKYGSLEIIRYKYYSKQKGYRDNKVYEEFKELYFKPNKPTVQYCIEQLKNKCIQENPANYMLDFPVDLFFLKRLKKEYSEAEIENYRNNEYTEENEDKFKFIIKEFLKPDRELMLAKSTKFLYSLNIFNHLNPFFGDFQMKDINKLSIEDFRKFKQEEGYKESTIKNQIAALNKILNYYEENI